MKSVEVRAPATSANLGPGFDCLGVALGIYLKVRFGPSDKSIVTGPAGERPAQKSLILRAFNAAFERAGKKPPTVRIEVTADYPSARGMGASASAIVAGLLGANHGGELGLSKSDLGRLGTDIEGHPDNVLPSLLGGLVICGENTHIRLSPAASIAPVVAVANKKFKTSSARKAVPNTVALANSVANTCSAALLVAILAGIAPPSDLMAATEDRLHQQHRLKLMPESNKLYRQLRQNGIACALSGAGPSLICLVEAGQVEATMKSIASIASEQWTCLSPGWDDKGAVTQQI